MTNTPSTSSFDEELREQIGSIIGSVKKTSAGEPAWFRQHTFELGPKNYQLEEVNVETEIDAILALLQPRVTALANRQAEQLAQERVREARIEEITRVLDNIHQGTLEPAVKARLAELQQGKEAA